MNIILFDDHKLFGDSLKRVLEQNSDIESFIFVSEETLLRENLREKETPILLLDINLRKAGVEDSFALGESLCREYPQMKLIYLSGYDLPMYRKKAREIGARGFFSKDTEVEDLLAGLRQIERGGFVWTKEDGLEKEKLTPAEVNILCLSAKGLSRSEISEKLYISSRTVGTHLTNIFQKLEVKNITEAIAKALKEGYIPPVY